MLAFWFAGRAFVETDSNWYDVVYEFCGIQFSVSSSQLIITFQCLLTVVPDMAQISNLD